MLSIHSLCCYDLCVDIVMKLRVLKALECHLICLGSYCLQFNAPFFVHAYSLNSPVYALVESFPMN